MEARFILTALTATFFLGCLGVKTLMVFHPERA